MALKSYANAVDPQSPDYLLWRQEGQTLVDGAYVAESFLRAYDQLWKPLDETTKKRYIEEFQQLRRIASSLYQLAVVLIYDRKFPGKSRSFIR